MGICHFTMAAVLPMATRWSAKWPGPVLGWSSCLLGAPTGAILTSATSQGWPRFSLSTNCSGRYSITAANTFWTGDHCICHVCPASGAAWKENHSRALYDGESTGVVHSGLLGLYHWADCKAENGHAKGTFLDHQQFSHSEGQWLE